MDNINNENNSNSDINKKLRCINIDCVFNSSNNPDHTRNICNHPKLIVDSKFADITIAICSEFRSKKDYSFEPPDKLVEIKSGFKIEIKGSPDIGSKDIEKVTIEELEKDFIEHDEAQKPEIKPVESSGINYETPRIIGFDEKKVVDNEPILLGDKRFPDFQILKKLYQPNLKRGIIISILFHVFVIFLVFSFSTGKNQNNNDQNTPRKIVIVTEDIDNQKEKEKEKEKEKFEPPDIDRQKELELKRKQNMNIAPITPKPIKVPKLIRTPKNNSLDTTDYLAKRQREDSLKKATDSLLAAKNKIDTGRFTLPDSLKLHLTNDELGIHLDLPKNENWGVIKNTDLGLPAEQFKGEIVGPDSASSDFKDVFMVIEIADPKHPEFNLTKYKNTFDMNDSTSDTITAFYSDPRLGGLGRIGYSYYIKNGNTGYNDLIVNVDLKNKDYYDKYKQRIEFVVRSIRLILNKPVPGSSEPKK